MTNQAIDWGPSAFPRSETDTHYGAEGMTLRDYFAGQALVGILASRPPSVTTCTVDIAQQSFWMADAMIERRELREPASPAPSQAFIDKLKGNGASS